VINHRFTRSVTPNLTLAEKISRREIEKLEKERKHLVNVRQALVDKGDEAPAAKMAAELETVEAGLQGLHDREANIRAGYVYVLNKVHGGPGSSRVQAEHHPSLVPLMICLEYLGSLPSNP
jgi:hypothetical protein